MAKIQLVECPRDAMQGIEAFIPTETKAAYLNQLLKVGFHTLDFGSFVSPKAIPQMRDTGSVLNRLDLDATQTQLLAIVANARGAEQACDYDQIEYLGFPFSVSETFQQRNTRKSISEAFEQLEVIKNTCEVFGKQLVVYVSMAFGNPYGDVHDDAIVAHWVDRLFTEIGADMVSLADTVGLATPAQVGKLVGMINEDFSKYNFGVHLHTRPDGWREKLDAAVSAGCLRIDGALGGYGGCPMAKDELVGNMPMERIVGYFEEKGAADLVDGEELTTAMGMMAGVFNSG